MFGLSGSNAVTWANVGYLLSLVLTLVLSVTLWRTTVNAQLESDAQLVRYKADAAKEVAEANARAAVASNEAAQANERAAKLEVALQTIRTPRRISEEQRKRFNELVQNAPKGTVTLVAGMLDPEQISYRDDIRGLLENSGYQIAPPPRGLVGLGFLFSGVLVGIHDPTNVPAHFDALQQALHGNCSPGERVGR